MLFSSAKILKTIRYNDNKDSYGTRIIFLNSDVIFIRMSWTETTSMQQTCWKLIYFKISSTFPTKFSLNFSKGLWLLFVFSLTILNWLFFKDTYRSNFESHKRLNLTSARLTSDVHCIRIWREKVMKTISVTVRRLPRHLNS